MSEYTHLTAEQKALAAAAEVATPGKREVALLDPERDPVELWRENLSHSEQREVFAVWLPDHPLSEASDDPQRPKHCVTVAFVGNGPDSEANAEFAAACDRETILALLADLNAARAALAENGCPCSGAHAVDQDNERLRAALSRVRAAYLRELDDETIVGVTGIVAMIDEALEVRE